MSACPEMDHAVSFRPIGGIEHPLSGLNGFTEVRSSDGQQISLVPAADADHDVAAAQFKAGRAFDVNPLDHVDSPQLTWIKSGPSGNPVNTSPNLVRAVGFFKHRAVAA